MTPEEVSFSTGDTVCAYGRWPKKPQRSPAKHNLPCLFILFFCFCLSRLPLRMLLWGDCLPTNKEPQVKALTSLLVARGMKVELTNLETFWNEAESIAPWISLENMREPDLWMWVLYLAHRQEIDSGTLFPISFIPILLAVIASLTSSSTEEVIASHNKCCEEQGTVNLLITTMPPMLSNVNSSGEEDEEATDKATSAKPTLSIGKPKLPNRSCPLSAKGPPPQYLCREVENSDGCANAPQPPPFSQVFPCSNLGHGPCFEEAFVLPLPGPWEEAYPINWV